MKGKIFLILSIILATVFVSAASWPADATGTQLVSSLPSPYEPSGLAWDAELGKLYVVSDEGIVSRMNLDGTNTENWYLSGDFEGVAVLSGKVYIGIEHPDSLVEFDPSTGKLTGRSWTFTNEMQSSQENYGLEGIGVVATSSGLRVYAGLQEDGSIYVYDINPQVSEEKTFVKKIPGSSSWLSDLSYDAQTGHLYAQYDSKIKKMDLEGNVLSEYTAPGTDQEGMVVMSSCPTSTATIVIASDTPASVMKYGNFPVSCPLVAEPTPVEEIVIDPSLIESFIVNRDKSITVSYTDGHSNSFTPFTERAKPRAIKNTAGDRLIVSNGKYLALYNNGEKVSQVLFNSQTLWVYTLETSPSNTGESITLTYTSRYYKYVFSFSLTNDNLQYLGRTKTKV